MIVWIQGIVATAVPWLMAHVLLPDQPVWALASLAVPVLFAALHARSPQAWLSPVAGALSVIPVIPIWASGIAVLAVCAILLLRPPRSSFTTSTTAADAVGSVSAQLRNGLLVALGLVLVLSGVAMVIVVAVQRQAQDASFDASQAAAEAAWSEAASPPASPSPEFASPSSNAASVAASAVADGPALVGAPTQIQAEPEAPVSPPFAKLRFLPREGDVPVVTDRVLYVGPDVTERGLKAGPGHYPTTAKPGKPGNIAIAGHRTGWGSPFADLDQLQPGDRVRVIDRKGTKHTYVVDSTRLVNPEEAWVLGPDPLGTGKPTLTLTTCDPPGVNTKRLIVFATLKRSVPASA